MAFVVQTVPIDLRVPCMEEKNRIRIHWPQCFRQADGYANDYSGFVPGNWFRDSIFKPCMRRLPAFLAA
jgi:hypothetical protein